MLGVLTFLSSFFFCFSELSPGRAILWSSKQSNTPSPANYITKSVKINDLEDLLKSNLLNKEVLITFCSTNEETKEFYTNKVFKQEILQSGDSIILPNLYQSSSSGSSSGSSPSGSSSSSISNICQNLIDSSLLKDTKVVTSNELNSLLSNSDILSNNQLESYLINIQSNSDIDYQSLFSTIQSSSKVLFLALQNPSSPPPLNLGNYHRLLSSDIEDGVNYLPEGTEFSIYYQAQYLYLTPDIFTGIMTGIFVSFVLFIGFNCMGAIQGSSSYPTVLPPLGKEG